MIDKDNIEKRVLLLAIYKKQSDESLNDVVLILSDTEMFTKKEGKKLLKELKDENFVDNNSLTMNGINEAKKIELDFKI